MNLMSQPSSTSAERIGQFLRNYYIYLVLVGVVVLLSLANIDRFDLFERGNFLSERNIINILSKKDMINPKPDLPQAKTKSP